MKRTKIYFQYLASVLRASNQEKKFSEFWFLLRKSKTRKQPFRRKFLQAFKNLYFYVHRPSTTPFHEKKKDRSRKQWLLLNRPKRPQPEKDKLIRKIVLEKLSTPPRISHNDIGNWFSRNLDFVRIILSRQKDPAAEGDSMSVSRFYLKPALHDDFIRFRAAFYSSLKRLFVFTRTYWKFTAVVIVLSPFIIELILQSSALLSSFILKIRPVAVNLNLRQNEKVILCLGDSFTAGRFTTYSTTRYTDLLKRSMETRRLGDWQIINYSGSQLTSSDILLALPQLLKENQPAIVYVMIGINDFSEEQISLPARILPANSRAPSWFRTGILINSWKDSNFSQGLFDAVTATLRPAKEKNRFEKEKKFVPEEDFRKLLTEVQSAQRIPVNFRDTSSREFSIIRDKDLLGWPMLQRGSISTAELQFRNAIKEDAQDPMPYVGLVGSYYALNLQGSAKKEMNWLTREFQTDPNPEKAGALWFALSLSASHEKPPELRSNIVNRYANHPEFWLTLARCAFLSGRPDIAVEALEKAVVLIPEKFPKQKAGVLRARAEIVSEKDPEKGLRSLMEAFLLDANPYLFLNGVRRLGAFYLSIDIDEFLKQIDAPEDKKKVLRSLYREAADERLIRILSKMKANLKAMAEISREKGAEPIFLTYPISQPYIHEVSRNVAEQTGSRWLNLEAHFEKLLRENRERELFKRGRFTDAAMEEIAESIARDVQTNVVTDWKP